MAVRQQREKKRDVPAHSWLVGLVSTVAFVILLPPRLKLPGLHKR